MSRTDAPAVTAGDQDRARRAGGYAARAGRPVTVCPWNPGGDARHRALASAFVRGYLHARPPAGVDHDDQGSDDT